MYTLTLLSTLFATSALAIPNPEKHSAVTSAGYGAWPSKPTHTVVITTTVVVSPVPEVQTTSLLATSSSTLPTFILAPNSTQTQSPSSASVSATPTFSAEPEPEELAGVYICADVNWAGECIHHLTPLGTSPEACTQLDGKASAIGPDLGFVCTFYANSFCDPLLSDGSDRIELQYPGEGNLVESSFGNWNDKVYSYQCLKA